MKKLVIRKNQDRRVKEGYLWLFSNEIETVPPGAQLPGIIRLETSDGRFLGLGFYNPNSLIAVRILTRHEENIDETFFFRRITEALLYREKNLEETDSYRLVFGEADFLPGLVIDRYGASCHIKITSKGMALLIAPIISALDKVLKPENIFVSIDATTARLENVSVLNEWVKGKNPGQIIITENGLKFYADIETGQKTGYYFDQRDNRGALRKYVPGKSVLDGFCYTGSFSCFSSFYGAREVLGLDSSKESIDLAEKNARLNGSNNCKFIKADIFSYLASDTGQKEKFDIVLLDPPGLIKSKKSFFEGLKKYVEINSLGMKAVERNGLLVSSSCSHHLDFPAFNKMLSAAAGLAKRKIRIAEYGFQARDHPVLPGMPETLYLKTAFCRIM